MTALKWITNEAKKLKKAYPKRFATWREYVAQASAIYASKHKGKSPVGKKHKTIGAAGDYAKFEIETIKALAKKIKKSYKATQIIVNNDQSILNIISTSFDQKLTPAQTVKIIVQELTPAETKSPLKAFVDLMNKPGKKGKTNFPMKLPATVTIGSTKKKTVKKKALAKSYHKDTHSHNVKISVMSGTTKGAFNMVKIWENVYGKLAQELISTSDPKQKTRIKKEMYVVKEILKDTKKLTEFKK